MKLKSETSKHVMDFVSFAETQFNSKIKTIRSDNGKEFFLHDFYSKRGITHQTSCVETPQQNAIVERKHQHILGVARAIIFQSHLPKCFCNYVISHAIHLINRQLIVILSNHSPYEELYQKLPNIKHLRVFGCLCFASTFVSHRSKLDPRSRKCVFLGFKLGTKGYILLDIITNEILISRNVLFYEHILPFTKIPESTSHSHTNDTLILPKHQLDPFNYTISTSDFQSTHVPYDQVSQTDQQLSNNQSIPPSNDRITRHSTRHRKPPTYLQDYHCSLLSKSSNQVFQAPKYHISTHLSYDNLSSRHRFFSLSISTNTAPTHYHEVIQHDCWKDAIQNELTALEKNNTWTLTNLPKDKHAIACKWVFKIKHKAGGNIERYKARLVAKGYNQIEGVDYLDTFSPVIKMTTIRVILSFTAIFNWHLHQLDVNTTFLHGDLNEEVYMKAPHGLNVQKSGMVCKLHKSVYGLKQSSRQWHKN
ncbi:putative RNA-directed DNA polymerase [Lupinus albus]|uniref:Putative RNA-directed DNA polymerase n=1 Tax=Lupinus albus TaxID=3870 RepID=A0A6A4N866_LUPAL|nr:putative RNA-directed DNA polymerase [Lupinus albus]